MSFCVYVYVYDAFFCVKYPVCAYYKDIYNATVFADIYGYMVEFVNSAEGILNYKGGTSDVDRLVSRCILSQRRFFKDI